ncbi:MAG TPA: biopolymer transporter ExbD [Longimicrobiales bacterium]|nr:biopolymer transporter ExbD [Longimicrobiales bacterium]
MAIMRERKRASGAIPTSSMADIAFLLLIFFLVTTVFDEERGLPIVLPEPQNQVEVSQKNILHIVVRADGLVDIRYGESPQVRTVRHNELEGIWRYEAANNPNLIAAVKTDPEAPYRHMINVLDELQGAGAERISLQILE